MNAVLAAAPHADTFGYSMPPPGLLRLGGALRRRGIAVRLDDLAYQLAAGELPAGDRLAFASAERLLALEPRVLGLSVMGATVPIAVAIARDVKERAPAVPVVLGGPGTTGVDELLLERFPWIDAVARGEGEETAPELVSRLLAGDSPAGVRGVTWRRASGAAVREPDRPPLADLGALPPYAWDLLPSIAAYKAVTGEAEGLVPVDSGRGCVYDCSFCTIGRFWSRRSRPLPVERLVGEVAALRGIPGARNAYLCHDIFGADRAHAEAFCLAMIERAAGVPWECRARVDHLDDALLELMGRAGCYRVLLGIESADPGVRDANAKHMARDVDVLHVVERCAAHGVLPILSFILGLPGEDEPALRRTLDLARDASVAAGVNLSLHLVNPQPGCGLGEAHGGRARPVAGIPPDMALGAGTTAPERELIDAHPDLFGTWALLTDLPGGAEHLRALHELATALPTVLMRFPRTFALVGRRRGEDTLDVYRAWRDSGSDFERFAAAQGEPLIDDVLAWEQAIERAPAEPELVRARFDLPAAARALRGGGWPDLPREETHLAVVRGPVGVRTLRVTPKPLETAAR